MRKTAHTRTSSPRDDGQDGGRHGADPGPARRRREEGRRAAGRRLRPDGRRPKGRVQLHETAYKTNVDDSVAIVHSLDDITISSLVLIALVIAIFFRRFWPAHRAVGHRARHHHDARLHEPTLGRLNMVTSIIAAMLGFGIDHGIPLHLPRAHRFGTGSRGTTRFARRQRGPPGAHLGHRHRRLVLRVARLEFRGFAVRASSPASAR